MWRLNDDDGRLVDLVLDAGPQAAAEPSVETEAAAMTVAPPLVASRLLAVESLLGLLEHLPAFDPPDQLVLRTLGFVEAHADRPVTPGDPGDRPRLDPPPPPGV